MVTQLRCIFCSSTQHNYRNCDALYKRSAQQTHNQTAKQNYVGQAPNVFVGQFGYPKVNVGLLNTEQYTAHDDPLRWSKEQFTQEKIVSLRTSLINARSPLEIKSVSTAPPSGFSSRFLEITREVSLAKKETDIALSLEKKPMFRTHFSEHAAPHGPAVGVKTAALQQNTSFNHHMEKAAGDTDLLATQAVNSLYKKGVDEHKLVRAFSVGNFGLGTKRKLVPTRWSITAVDDTLGKKLIEQVKDLPEGGCELYIGDYFGNHYLIMCFDDVWQYELYELFVPQKNPKKSSEIFIEQDYESYTGRKSYASETVGGYYATRLGVLEAQTTAKRQASVLVIRIITEEYTAPLGVWVVREAVRKTLLHKPLIFGEREAMIKAAKKYAAQNLNFDLDVLYQRSNVLKNLRNQTKLKKWF